MKRPSRWWYLVGALVSIGGCGGVIANGIASMTDTIDNMERAVMPGTATLSLEPGAHTAYYESESTVDGERFSTGDSLSGLRCELVSPSGEQVALESTSASSTYTLGSRSGASLFDFDVERAGDYALRCDYDGPRIVLAFGPGLFGSIMWTVVPALVLGFGGLAIVVIVAIKRRKRIEAVPVAQLR